MRSNLKNLPREVFQDPFSRESKRYISIGRESFNKPDSATIYRFSSGIVSKYNLDDYTHVQLSYNEPFQVIYFRLFRVTEGQKIPPWYFKITKDRGVRKISALRFTRKYQINKDKYVGRYPVEEINIGKNDLELAIELPKKDKIE